MTDSTTPTTPSEKDNHDKQFDICQKFLSDSATLWGGDVRRVQVACIAAYSIILAEIYKGDMAKVYAEMERAIGKFVERGRGVEEVVKHAAPIKATS
jgi:hypothetical protein